MFQAYASLGAGALGLLGHDTVRSVAHSHGVSPAQTLLRWGMQHNCALLPKSANEERIRSNLEIWDFKLDAEEMRSLDNLDQGQPGQNTMAGWLREHDPDFY